MVSKSRGKGVYQHSHRPFNRVFKSPADAFKAKEPTSTRNGAPPTPTTTCPKCGAEVSTRYRPGMAGVDRRRYVSKHRPGGGQVSVRRGDVQCPGEGAEVAMPEEA